MIAGGESTKVNGDMEGLSHCTKLSVQSSIVRGGLELGATTPSGIATKDRHKVTAGVQITQSW